MDQLVDHLLAAGVLRTGPLEQAMRRVDRARFLPRERERAAYRDEPQPIGSGQTISAPHMVALLVEAMELRGDEKVLEVGTGSGYNAAITAELLPHGGVVTTEIVPELAAQAIRRLREGGFDNVQVLAADGGAGWPDLAPYDAIYYTCAVPEVPPAVWEQVREGGRVVVPLGRRECHLMRYRNREERWSAEDLGLCAFVPLTGAHA